VEEREGVGKAEEGGKGGKEEMRKGVNRKGTEAYGRGMEVKGVLAPRLAHVYHVYWFKN